MENSIFQQMYDMLGEISVRGHKDIKRMDAVMDVLLQLIEVSDKEVNTYEDLNQQRKDV